MKRANQNSSITFVNSKHMQHITLFLLLAFRIPFLHTSFEYKKPIQTYNGIPDIYSRFNY